MTMKYAEIMSACARRRPAGASAGRLSPPKTDAPQVERPKDSDESEPPKGLMRAPKKTRMNHAGRRRAEAVALCFDRGPRPVARASQGPALVVSEGPAGYRAEEVRGHLYSFWVRTLTVAAEDVRGRGGV